MQSYKYQQKCTYNYKSIHDKIQNNGMQHQPKTSQNDMQLQASLE